MKKVDYDEVLFTDCFPMRNMPAQAYGPAFVWTPPFYRAEKDLAFQAREKSARALMEEYRNEPEQQRLLMGLRWEHWRHATRELVSHFGETGVPKRLRAGFIAQQAAVPPLPERWDVTPLLLTFGKTELHAMREPMGGRMNVTLCRDLAYMSFTVGGAYGKPVVDIRTSHYFGTRDMFFAMVDEVAASSKRPTFSFAHAIRDAHKASHLPSAA